MKEGTKRGSRPRVIANQCNDHLGGGLGALVLARMLEFGWLKPAEGKRFELTESGRRGLMGWGLEV